MLLQRELALNRIRHRFVNIGAKAVSDPDKLLTLLS